MRKFIAIISLLSLSFGLVGYHLAFYLQLKQLKGEMKRSIRLSKTHEDVLQLSFTGLEAEKLAWENEEEFEYHGDMYDVIEKSYDHNKLVIRCIADKKEKDLLDAYQKDNQRNQANSKWSLAKLSSTVYTTVSFQMPAHPQQHVSIQFLTFTSTVFTLPHQILTPPPKRC